MKAATQQDSEVERRPTTPLWDTLIRVLLIGGLLALCLRVFSPFLNLAAWSIILAVTMYPLHQALARRIGRKQGLTSVLLVILGISVIVVPTWLLLNSLADSVHGFVDAVEQNTLQIPPPREGLRRLPVVGENIYNTWSQARTNLPALIKTMQPKLVNLAGAAVGMVASIGGTMLLFLVSFIVANIVMAYGESASSGGRAFFARVAGPSRGEALAKLALSTIRAVALGVIGVAAIQALLVGVALLFAGVPAAGVLAIVTLVLGIAQVPALIVTLPVIIYIWASGNYGTGAAVAHTIILLLTGMADNVLKPLMLGRGVDVPMPVILLGALGGMAGGGILGMFVGATGLALGYQLFADWVSTSNDLAQES